MLRSNRIHRRDGHSSQEIRRYEGGERGKVVDASTWEYDVGRVGGNCDLHLHDGNPEVVKIALEESNPDMTNQPALKSHHYNSPYLPP